MAVVIRLKRFGTTKRPHWRVVVADSRSPRDGRFIEEVGQYHPRTEPAGIVLDTERIDYWRSKGARLSDAARNLLKKAKASR